MIYKTINTCFIFLPLDPFARLADDDEAAALYDHVCPDDVEFFRALIRSEVCPYLARLTSSEQEGLRLAMRYCLTSTEYTDSVFRAVFESSMIPLPLPEHPRDFFLWVWEECFPGEPYFLEDIRDFQVNKNFDEVSRARPNSRLGETASLSGVSSPQALSSEESKTIRIPVAELMINRLKGDLSEGSPYDWARSKSPQECIEILKRLSERDFGADLVAWERWWCEEKLKRAVTSRTSQT